MLSKKITYYLIAIIAIVLSVVGAITSIVSNVAQNEYKQNLKQAEEYAEKKLYKKSSYYYDLVIENKDEAEYRLSQLDVIKKGVQAGEFGDNEYQDYLSKFVSSHYKEKYSYEVALEYYYSNQEYDSCVTLINQAKKYAVASEAISKKDEQISKKYKLIKTNYNSVTPFRNYMSRVELDSLCGIVLDNGTKVANTAYSDMSPYFYVTENQNEDRMWSFVKDGKKAYIVNRSFVRQGYLPDTVESSSGVGDALLSCKIGNRYKYYSIDGKEAFGNYTYASKFITDVAAAFDNGEWFLINTKGEKICNEVFDEIKLNQFDECVKNHLIFAKKHGENKFTAYSYNDGKITDTKKTFDDVDLPPAGGEPIAFKENGKWGFMDSALKTVISPQYANAHSFSNGYAGVEMKGGWNFIKSDGNLLLDLDDEFTDTGYFSVYENNKGEKMGYCYVELNEHWQLISLYKCS